MVINREVLALYGAVDNLRPFVHPEYGRRFRFMTPAETVGLAGQVLDHFAESGISTVVVSESGASPLIWICRKIAEQRGIAINWHYLKIPRDPSASVYPVIAAYLTEDELRPREWDLKKGCTRIHAGEDTKTLPNLLRSIETMTASTEVEQLSHILKGTGIHKLFDSPFLFFDEYIDSGTTLGNAVRYALYFSGILAMKIGCYYLNVDTPSDYKAISFALHSRTDKRSCFEKGIYPFENRVDLIGYWYTSAASFKKTYVADLIHRDETDASEFMNSLTKAADPSLLEQIRNGMHILPVRDYCRQQHVMQYLLYRLESELGVSEESTELLYQLFEMYAPIWSPLPDEYHIDFVSAFKPEIVSQHVSALANDYRAHRESILSAAARACEARRIHWRSTITHLITHV